MSESRLCPVCGEFIHPWHETGEIHLRSAGWAATEELPIRLHEWCAAEVEPAEIREQLRGMMDV